MGKDVKNLLIFIKGQADDGLRRGLERVLRRVPGVISVGLPRGKLHLVTVGYDPRQTDGLRLLQLAETFEHRAA